MAGDGLGRMPDPEAVQGLNLLMVESQQADPMVGGSGAGELDHFVSSEGKKAEKAGLPAASATEESAAPPFVLSEGLAPILVQLVAKIQWGEFVDMAELLRDNLEAIHRGALPEQLTLPHQPRHSRRKVPDLLSWVQCFGTYMAIVATKHLQWIKQLLAYQTLIAQEAKRCGGKGWLAYDSMFCQQVAANKDRGGLVKTQQLLLCGLLPCSRRRREDPLTLHGVRPWRRGVCPRMLQGKRCMWQEHQTNC